MSVVRRAALAVVALGLLSSVCAALVLPGAVERRYNRTGGEAWPVSPHARALHDRLRIADLHADTLLWHRDPLARADRGHVDLPRLQDGGVRLQVFGIVTRVPRGSSYERPGEGPDLIRLLALAQRWPPRTWGSLVERALYQAGRLHDAAARSGGELRVVRSPRDLQLPEGTVGALLALEGSHALLGRLDNLDRLHAAGLRMASPSHFFDTEIGGSAHGAERGGLTTLGVAWLERMDQLGIVVDLAHASPRTFRDVIGRARRPVVVSHAGVRATCPTPRNVTDDQLRALAANGGVIGIGFWDDVVCGRDPAAIAKAVRHAVRVAGPRHVGLGSDFDGTVRVPFDAAGLAALTHALIESGLDEPTIRGVMGENVFRVLGESLGPS